MVLLVCLLVLHLLQVRGVWLVVLALATSGLASFVLLSRQRDAVSDVVAGRVDRARRRLDEGAAGEDDD